MNRNTANTSSNPICLTVLGERSRYVMQVRNKTSFQRLIDMFCKKTGTQKDSVQFLCDGRLLSGDKSVKALGLENHDVIETHISQTDNIPRKVQVKVFGLENTIVEMLVEKQVALENLMFAYSECLHVRKNSIVFKLGNKIIRDKDTASSIRLKDGDLITVSRQLIKRKLHAEHLKKPPTMPTMHLPTASTSKQSKRRRKEYRQQNNRRVDNSMYYYY